MASSGRNPDLQRLNMYRPLVTEKLIPAQILHRMEPFLPSDVCRTLRAASMDHDRSAAVNRLLDSLVKHDKPGWFQGLIEALQQTGFRYLAKLLEGKTHIRDDDMESDLIKVCLTDIVEKVDCLTIMPYLIENGCLTSADADKIRACRDKEGNRVAVYAMIMDHVQSKSNNWFSLFIAALKTSGYEHVAEMIGAELSRAESQDREKVHYFSYKSSEQESRPHSKLLADAHGDINERFKSLTINSSTDSSKYDMYNKKKRMNDFSENHMTKEKKKMHLPETKRGDFFGSDEENGQDEEGAKNDEDDEENGGGNDKNERSNRKVKSVCENIGRANLKKKNQVESHGSEFPVPVDRDVELKRTIRSTKCSICKREGEMICCISCNRTKVCPRCKICRPCRQSETADGPKSLAAVSAAESAPQAAIPKSRSSVKYPRPEASRQISDPIPNPVTPTAGSLKKPRGKSAAARTTDLATPSPRPPQAHEECNVCRRVCEMIACVTCSRKSVCAQCKECKTCQEKGLAKSIPSHPKSASRSAPKPCSVCKLETQLLPCKKCGRNVVCHRCDLCKKCKGR